MGPPPRKKVEYASGIVVSDDGAIVTDRQAVDGCMSIVVAGYGNADKVAEDKVRDLALLRIYGARELKPLSLGAGAAKPNLDLVGIADPQNQGGGAAVTSVKASTTPVGTGSELALSPRTGVRFFRRGRHRQRRQIRGPRAVEATARCRPAECSATGGAGARGNSC